MKTFEQCKQDEPGTIYADWEEGKFRCLVLRGPGSLCRTADYQPARQYRRKDYGEIDIDCHGGLTFAHEGDGKAYPEKYWWFGWDYAHFGDAVFYDLSFAYDRKWTPDDVIAEFPDVIKQFEEVSNGR